MRRRILAVRQDNNGDVTLVGPALRALARQGDVTLLCGPSGEGAARLLPAVDAILVERAEWIEASPRAIDRGSIARCVAQIEARAFDEAFIFTSFHQSPLPAALLLRLAGVGRVAAISVDYPGSLLDARVSVDDGLHEVERALALVGSQGYALAPGDDGSLAYTTLPERDRTLPDSYVAIQPGASVPARAWAPEKMRDTVALLTQQGRACVIVGNEAERGVAKMVAGRSGARVAAGLTTYAEFAAIVRDAEALVVGNTSGLHVAGAVGTPVVTIFPPTIPPQRFAPWHVPYVMLGDANIGCAGCRSRICPIEGQPCIGVVTPNEVAAAVALVARHASVEFA